MAASGGTQPTLVALPENLTLRIRRIENAQAAQNNKKAGIRADYAAVATTRPLVDSASIGIEPIVLIRNYGSLLNTAVTDSIVRRQYGQLFVTLRNAFDSRIRPQGWVAAGMTYPLMVVKNDLVLHVQPVHFAPQNYTPDSVISQLYLRLARAGHQANPVLKRLVKVSGQRAAWNAWLPRHHVQLRTPLADEPRQGLLRRQFRYDLQRQLMQYSADIADSIARAQRRLRPEPIKDAGQAFEQVRRTTSAPQQQAPGPSKTAPDKEPVSVLYDREFVLPTVPIRRIMHVTISDRGSSATAHNQARYLVCARYTTRSGAAYQGLTVPGGCLPQTGFVSAAADLVQVERELFVEKLVQALDTGTLKSLTDDSVVVLSGRYLVAADSMQNIRRLLQQATRDSITAVDSLANVPALKLRMTQATQDSVNAILPENRKIFELSHLWLQKRINRLETYTAQAAALEKHRQNLLVRLGGAAAKLVQAQNDLVKGNLRSITKSIRSQDVLSIHSSQQIVQPKVPGNIQKRINAVPAQRGRGGGPAAPEEEPVAQDPAARVVSDDEIHLRALLLDIILDFLRQQERYLAAPKAGTILVSEKVAVYHSMHDTHFRPVAFREFLLDSVQMKVEDGSVTDLKAVGSVGGQVLLFENHTPIGISSDADLNRQNSWYRRYLWSQARFKMLPHNHRMFIQLDELLRYFPSSENEDRSPANGVYTFRPNDPLIRRTLTKEATSKILQARVFTDLAGVENDRPNGLVQVEIDKKIMFGSTWSRNSPSLQFRPVGYIIPLVAITKVEQQNRELPLTPNLTEPTAPPFTVNTIDLLRYTNLRVGVDLNLAGLRFPKFKSDYSLDFGFYLHRVSVRGDSVQGRSAPRVDSTLNVANYGLHLKWRIRPDSRYGLQSRLGYVRYALINSIDNNNRRLIRQTPEPAVIHPGAKTMFAKYFFQGVMQYELMGWLRVADNSMFFVRPQFSHPLFQASRTFFQFQVGYQFDVFARRRDVPVGPPSLFPTP